MCIVSSKEVRRYVNIEVHEANNVSFESVNDLNILDQY